jgi:phosphohistidine phosphatase
MPMRLILVRHAEAADYDPSLHQNDGLRPLTPEGRRAHTRMAAALARVEPGASRILTSPLLRARETAEITAGAIGVSGGDIRILEALGDGFSKKGLLEEIRRLPPEARVILVGHAPTLGELAAGFLHRGGDVAIEFEKSSTLCLDFAGYPAAGAAALLWFLTPKSLPGGPAG